MKQFLLFVTLLGLTSTINAQQQSMLLWYDHPAQFFEESLPMGNGKLGALVYGGTKNDTIYLQESPSTPMKEQENQYGFHESERHFSQKTIVLQTLYSIMYKVNSQHLTSH